VSTLCETTSVRHVSYSLCATGPVCETTECATQLSHGTQVNDCARDECARRLSVGAIYTHYSAQYILRDSRSLLESLGDVRLYTPHDMCDMTHSYVRYETLETCVCTHLSTSSLHTSPRVSYHTICATCLIHMCDMNYIHMCDMNSTTHVYRHVWHVQSLACSQTISAT